VSPECPEPVRRAVMVQQWRELAYLHWRYEPSEIQRLLPKGLEVDTFDGSAWVGLIPFSMRNIGLPKLPPVPYFGSFPEINVRTYVTRNGIPGVWFFSLDINRLLPAVVARTTYLLPYCWGSASNTLTDGILTTTVQRRWPRRAAANIKVHVGDAISEPDDLSVFLSARWGLYSRGLRGGLMYAPVDHERWPLYSGTCETVESNLFEVAGLTAPVGQPHVMYSPGVSVRVGLPRRSK
jgi:uncharacterized protein YqjF (DUF2071 family)